MHFDFFGRVRENCEKQRTVFEFSPYFRLPHFRFSFACKQRPLSLSLPYTHTHIDHALVICNAFVNANCAQLQQQPAKCANKHDKQLHVMPHTHTHTHVYMYRVYVFSHTYLAILAWLPISVTQTFINFALICHRLFVSLTPPATCRQHQRQSIVITEDGTV